MDKENILNALKELRKEKKRKFAQTLDLIINLKNFDVKRQSINTVISVPHKIKDSKVCAFFSEKSKLVNTVPKSEFEKYKDKKAMKGLMKKYDSFIASAPLMPAVATSFGKVLGPAGKMPSPQLGILPSEEERAVKELLGRINKLIKIKTKEASLKISVGKEDLKDDEIAENVLEVYKKIFEELPRKKENIKSVLIKLTMSKPIKISID